MTRQIRQIIACVLFYWHHFFPMPLLISIRYCLIRPHLTWNCFRDEVFSYAIILDGLKFHDTWSTHLLCLFIILLLCFPLITKCPALKTQDVLLFLKKSNAQINFIINCITHRKLILSFFKKLYFLFIPFTFWYGYIMASSTMNILNCSENFKKM